MRAGCCRVRWEITDATVTIRCRPHRPRGRTTGSARLVVRSSPRPHGCAVTVTGPARTGPVPVRAKAGSVPRPGPGPWTPAARPGIPSSLPARPDHPERTERTAGDTGRAPSASLPPRPPRRRTCRRGRGRAALNTHTRHRLARPSRPGRPACPVCWAGQARRRGRLAHPGQAGHRPARPQTGTRNRAPDEAVVPCGAGPRLRAARHQAHAGHGRRPRMVIARHGRAVTAGRVPCRPGTRTRVRASVITGARGLKIKRCPQATAWTGPGGRSRSRTSWRGSRAGLRGSSPVVESRTWTAAGPAARELPDNSRARRSHHPRRAAASARAGEVGRRLGARRAARVHAGAPDGRAGGGAGSGRDREI